MSLIFNRYDGEVVISDALDLQRPLVTSSFHFATASRSKDIVAYAVSDSEVLRVSMMCMLSMKSQCCSPYVVLQIRSFPVEDRIALLVAAGQFDEAICVATSIGDNELTQVSQSTD